MARIRIRAEVLIAFLLAFFPVMINTMLGFKSIQREAGYLMQTMGARRSQVLRYLLVPHALPSICGSLKIAITLATVGAIVGEFIGSNIGLGYVLMTANGILDAGLLFVALFWITIVALIFYAAVSLAERLLIPWHVSVRGPGRYSGVLIRSADGHGVDRGFRSALTGQQISDADQ